MRTVVPSVAFCTIAPADRQEVRYRHRNREVLLQTIDDFFIALSGDADAFEALHSPGASCHRFQPLFRKSADWDPIVLERSGLALVALFN